MKDTAYIDRINGQWEAFAYSDGIKVPLGVSDRKQTLIDKLTKRGFHIVTVEKGR